MLFAFFVTVSQKSNSIDMKILWLSLFLVCFLSLDSMAQGDRRLSKFQTWQLLDYQQDSVYGTSVNRAYKELLAGKKAVPVIVAVIDEGVDISQEDLHGHIWTNQKEVAGNGIDDDHNGYTDDTHGWNFLGGKNGKNIYATSSEADREFYRLAPAFPEKDTTIYASRPDYKYFLKVKALHIKDSVGRNTDNYPRLSAIISRLAAADSMVKKQSQLSVIHNQDVIDYHPTDSAGMATKGLLTGFYSRQKPDRKAMSLDSIISLGKEAMGSMQEQEALYRQVSSDPAVQRKEIVGDDPFDISDTHYGNNLVGDHLADHGTHCSGIIAAVRGNGIGIDGVTDHVLIMPVRAVNEGLFGDERDKDIALAIRYAVDNGARVISMSFGKRLSPQQQWVEDAIKYAEKKGVLMVRAAMNDHLNNDSVPSFPTADFISNHGRATNMISVGASSIDTGMALPAPFSNYGQTSVDLFAPGVDIYSTYPGNKYQYASGTSMATPVVAGIAALILEYYPDLTAVQVKAILLQGVTSLKGKMVYKPGTKEKVDFATLSITGGIVNAYNSLKMAAAMSKMK